jgi:hypothetical protein
MSEVVSLAFQAKHNGEYDQASIGNSHHWSAVNYRVALVFWVGGVDSNFDSRRSKALCGINAADHRLRGRT